jgi:serine/threonine protein kinase
MLPANHRFHGYQLQEAINQGGFGTVYCALESALQREVAIKVVRFDMLPDNAAIQQAQQRFLQEDRTQAGLNHPSIMPIYAADIDQTTGVLYYHPIAGNNLVERVRYTPHPTGNGDGWVTINETQYFRSSNVFNS